MCNGLYTALDLEHLGLVLDMAQAQVFFSWKRLLILPVQVLTLHSKMFSSLQFLHEGLMVASFQVVMFAQFRYRPLNVQTSSDKLPQSLDSPMHLCFKARKSLTWCLTNPALESEVISPI